MNNNFLDLDERKKIWLSFSDLFLDTDVSLFYQSIIKTCALSTYSIAELEAILKNEVTPACSFNLYSIAGEWAGFDDDWLVARVLDVSKNKNPFTLLYKNMTNNINIFLYVDKHWNYLAKKIEETRNKS